MQILIVRHGDKTFAGDDAQRGLSDEGVAQVAVLTAKLARRDVAPSLYLTSTSQHARGTAAQLHETLPAERAEVMELATLTPPGGPAPADVLDALVDECSRARLELAEHRTVAVVGHEPRLSQLLTCMTGRRLHPLADAEAVCVAGDGPASFLKGQAAVEFRTASSDASESQLRPKLGSKMTVAALLAGFTATALIEVIAGGRLTGWDLAGAACLTAALTLFIACVFIYDQLSMPEGFWVYGQRPSGAGDTDLSWPASLGRRLEGWGEGLRRKTSESAKRRRSPFAFGDALQYGGPVYAYMVWTWTFVFTPAVTLAGFGLVVLFAGAGGVLFVALGGLIIAVVLAYFAMVRPRLGAD